VVTGGLWFSNITMCQLRESVLTQKKSRKGSELKLQAPQENIGQYRYQKTNHKDNNNEYPMQGLLPSKYLLNLVWNYSTKNGF